MRAEFSGAIIEAEKILARQRASLESLGVTILLFDPMAKPATIKPCQKRSSPARFRAGDFSRAVLASLRGADSPLTVRAIAARAAVATGMDVSTTAAMSQAVVRVRAALARPNEGLVCEKHGKEPMTWQTVV